MALSQNITNSGSLVPYTVSDIVFVRASVTSFSSQTLVLALDTQTTPNQAVSLSIFTEMGMTKDPINDVPLVAGNFILLQCKVNTITGSPGAYAVVNLTVQEQGFNCTTANFNVFGAQVSNASELLSNLSA